MMRFVLCALALLVAGPAAAGEVALYDGRVRLDVPGGFRPASEAEILGRYPRPQRPDHVFTENDNLAVAITVRRTALPPNVTQPIAELGASVVERQLAGQPGVTMHRHAPVTVNGREWYAIEFSSPAPDGARIENALRMTVADGHLVLVSFSAFAPLYAQHERSLRAALDSAVVR